MKKDLSPKLSDFPRISVKLEKDRKFGLFLIGMSALTAIIATFFPSNLTPIPPGLTISIGLAGGGAARYISSRNTLREVIKSLSEPADLRTKIYGNYAVARSYYLAPRGEIMQEVKQHFMENQLDTSSSRDFHVFGEKPGKVLEANLYAAENGITEMRMVGLGSNDIYETLLTRLSIFAKHEV